MRIIIFTILFSFLSLPVMADGIKYFAKQTYVAKKVDGKWQIGMMNDGKWQAYEEDWLMMQVPFNGANGDEIDFRGRGHAGTNVDVITPPLRYRGREVNFVIDESSVSDNQEVLEFNLGGKVILDRTVYKKIEGKTSAGGSYNIYSRENNPDVDTIENILETLAKKFPFQSKRNDPPTIVSIQNDKEGINGELDASGFHRGNFVLLNSVTGADTYSHRLHELAGLYRLENEAAHGLTWFVAYDQNLRKDLKNELQKPVSEFDNIEKLLADFAPFNIHCPEDGNNHTWSDDLKASRKVLNEHTCNAITSAMFHLENAGGRTVAAQDKESPLSEYVAREKRNSYRIHAWGSAYIWMLINLELERKGEPTLYDLINKVHQKTANGQGFGDINQLIKNYEELNPGNSTFKKLASFYFLDQSSANVYEHLKKLNQEYDCKD